jgi:hypothetical protein
VQARRFSFAIVKMMEKGGKPFGPVNVEHLAAVARQLIEQRRRVVAYGHHPCCHLDAGESKSKKIPEIYIFSFLTTFWLKYIIINMFNFNHV